MKLSLYGSRLRKFSRVPDLLCHLHNLTSYVKFQRSQCALLEYMGTYNNAKRNMMKVIRKHSPTFVTVIETQIGFHKTNPFKIVLNM